MSSIALLNMANMKSANFIIKNVLDKNPLDEHVEYGKHGCGIS